jgi:hypothetical protein
MGRILPLFFLDLCSSESIVVVFRVRRRIGSTVGAPMLPGDLALSDLLSGSGGAGHGGDDTGQQMHSIKAPRSESTFVNIVSLIRRFPMHF